MRAVISTPQLLHVSGHCCTQKLAIAGADGDVQKLRAATESFTLEGDLRRQEGMALKRLQDIGCVRGRRHRLSLPVRGQRTRTNARTRRGSRKTVAGRKK